MEIEVKLRIPNAEEHQKVLSLLSPYTTATHNQRNTFFDGAASELSSRRAVLRLRFYETTTGNPRCFICLKAKSTIVNGVSRVEEDEEEVDATLAYECVNDPNLLMTQMGSSRIVKRVKEEFQVEGFVGLGGFRNVRNVFEWNGVKLEVDETIYEFGSCYEIECESEEPEKVKATIEDFLKENGIVYSYSDKSKFAIFRSGMLP